MTVGQIRKITDLRTHLEKCLNKTKFLQTIDAVTGEEIRGLLLEIADLSPEDKRELSLLSVKLREEYNQKYLKPRGRL